MRIKIKILVFALLGCNLVMLSQTDEQVESDAYALFINRDSTKILQVEEHIKNGRFGSGSTVVACAIIWDKWHLPFALKLGYPYTKSEWETKPDDVVHVFYVRYLMAMFVAFGADSVHDEFVSYFKFCEENSINPLLRKYPVWDDSFETEDVGAFYRQFRACIPKDERSTLLPTDDDKTQINQILNQGIANGELLCILSKAYMLIHKLLPLSGEDDQLIELVLPVNM